MRSQGSSAAHGLLTVTLVIVTVVAAVGFGYLIGNWAIRLITSSPTAVTTTLADGKPTTPAPASTATPAAGQTQTQERTPGETAPSAPSTPPPEPPAQTKSSDTQSGLSENAGPPSSAGSSPAQPAAGGRDNAGAADAAGAGAALTRVQVGEFTDRSAALRAAEELKAKGYPVYVPAVPPYSVQVGAFQSKEAARKLKDEISAQGYDARLR